MKGGILEIADVFVVNKADIDGAENVAFDLQMMLQLKQNQDCIPEIVMTQALNNKGIDELYDAILKHGNYLKESGIDEIFASKNREFACINATVRKFKKLLIAKADSDSEIKNIIAEVKLGNKNPHKGANEILELMFEESIIH
jgi:LAO/AO transport system kinase